MRYACKLRQFLDHQTYEYVFSGRQLAVFETSERLRAVSFCVRVPKLLLEAIVRLRGFASVSIFRILPWELSVPVSLASHYKPEMSVAEFQSHVLERVSLC